MLTEKTDENNKQTVLDVKTIIMCDNKNKKPKYSYPSLEDLEAQHREKEKNTYMSTINA